ncbi:SDR family NAD(P)-dependent oxidoreductase [Amphibacillus sp. Q70]|uniref:SDR family NAD(P)-dependent oxidoreductase n=1 Tax=Amphibacillus sp. Q70 TaxID=3453416 RepID=UPI003F857B73
MIQGYTTFEGVGEIAYLEFDKVLNANIKAPYFVIQNLSSNISKNGGKINISSGVSRIVFPRIAVYSMPKGAINNLYFYNCERTRQ